MGRRARLSCHPGMGSPEVDSSTGHGEDGASPRRLGYGPHRGDTFLDPARDRDMPVGRRVQPGGHPFSRRCFGGPWHGIGRFRGLRLGGVGLGHAPLNPPLGLFLAGAAVGAPYEEDVGFLFGARGLDLLGLGTLPTDRRPDRGRGLRSRRRLLGRGRLRSRRGRSQRRFLSRRGFLNHRRLLRRRCSLGRGSRHRGTGEEGLGDRPPGVGTRAGGALGLRRRCLRVGLRLLRA